MNTEDVQSVVLAFTNICNIIIVLNHEYHDILAAFPLLLCNQIDRKVDFVSRHIVRLSVIGCRIQRRRSNANGKHCHWFSSPAHRR